MASSRETIEDLTRSIRIKATASAVRSQLMEADDGALNYSYVSFADLQRQLAEVPMTKKQREDVEFALKGIGILFAKVQA